MASMLRDLEAINAGADRAVLANPLLTGDLETLARAFAGDRARDRVRRRRSRADGARAQCRHEGRHRVAGRADVMDLPKIALTVGDPAGIGPEIVAKAAADPSVRAVCEPIVFAPPADAEMRLGEVSAAAGRAAYDTIVRAVEAAQERRRRCDRDRADQQAGVCAWPGWSGRATPICSRTCAARRAWR